MEQTIPVSNATRQNSIMPSEERLFEQMEKDLEEYGRAFEKGQFPPRAEYDPALFLRFRQWQADRLEADCQELFEDD